MPWEPSEHDYVDLFKSQNPWQRDGSVPIVMRKSKRRAIANSLWQRMLHDEPRRFQLVVGPRRVGKSVALYQTVQQLIDDGIEPLRLWWLHLAHPLLLSVPLGRLAKFVIDVGGATADKPAFLFLDELTYAPQWDTWLKTFYDDHLPLRILATSSATAALREGRTESGIGRWEEQYLAPCLFTEYLTLRDRGIDIEAQPSLFQTLDVIAKALTPDDDIRRERERFSIVGGFPELLLRGRADDTLFPVDDLTSEIYESQRILRDDAVQKAIYQDIPQVFGVQGPLNLERLLYTLAGQIGGLISLQTLASNVGLSGPTIESYLGYLERSYLIFLLQNYAPSEEARQRRGRKVYFVDAAVRNAALQRGTAPLRDPTEMGLILENLVASHLHALSQQNGVRIYHWRDGQHEVDFVYDDPNGPLAFEIASGANHATTGLRSFIERYPRFKGRSFLVYPSADVTSPHPQSGIATFPLDLMLIAVGQQAHRDLRMRLARV